MNLLKDFILSLARSLILGSSASTDSTTGNEVGQAFIACADAIRSLDGKHQAFSCVPKRRCSAARCDMKVGRCCIGPHSPGSKRGVPGGVGGCWGAIGWRSSRNTTPQCQSLLSDRGTITTLPLILSTSSTCCSPAPPYALVYYLSLLPLDVF